MMCELFNRCQEVFNTLNIPSQYINPVYNHCSCNNCRGGPEEEKGCCYFALQADPRKNLHDIFTNWHRCYHGTDMNFVRSIVINGLLIPGDVLSGMAPISIKPGHVPKENFVFASPFLGYSLSPTYAKHSIVNGRQYQFVFELRFKPGCYQNLGSEWKTKLRDSFIEIGLLIKEFDNNQMPVAFPLFAGLIPEVGRIKPLPKKKPERKIPHIIPPRVHPHPIRKPGPIRPSIKRPLPPAKVITGCGLCNKKDKTKLIKLQCNHQFHNDCIKQYIIMITEDRVLFISKEAKKYSVSCIVCQKNIEEKTIEKIFGKDFEFFDAQRNVREVEEIKAPEALDKAPEPPKREEAKVPTVEQYWLACCQKDVPLEEYRNLLMKSKENLFTISVDKELVPRNCPLCSTRIDFLDIKILFSNDIDRIITSNCANCNSQLQAFETILLYKINQRRILLRY